MKNVRWNAYYKKELLICLNLKVRFKIKTKHDCGVLAHLIAQDERINEMVSESTIYRMFVHQGPYNTRPYQNTLDIMARFCDYENWDDFCESLDLRSIRRQWNGRYAENPEGNTLLKSCLKFHAFDPVYDYLKDLEPEEDLEAKLHFDLGEDLYKALNAVPEATRGFYAHFSSLPIVRVAFFESLADPEFRVPNYEYGLKCYLRHIDDLATHKGKQDYVFGNSLLFRHYFKNNRREEWINLGERLFGEMAINESLVPHQIHIFPFSRQLAYRLLFEYELAEPAKRKLLIEDLFTQVGRIIEKLPLHDKRIFFYNLADVFSILGLSSRYGEDLKKAFKLMFQDLPPSLQKRSIPQLRDTLSMNADELMMF